MLPIRSINGNERVLITGVFARAEDGPSKAGKLVGVRLQDELLAKIDDWIGYQPDAPSRPEGIRRLLERALIEEQITANRNGQCEEKGPLNDR